MIAQMLRGLLHVIGDQVGRMFRFGQIEILCLGLSRVSSASVILDALLCIIHGHWVMLMLASRLSRNFITLGSEL